jgi:diguanylate cyclase (GGDEF)-like protein
MQLDLPTLMTMESFVGACAGSVLLVVWSQNRKNSALALWGLALIGIAAGVYSLTLESALDQRPWLILGRALLVAGCALTWKAARTFDAKPAPLALTLLGAGIIGLVSCVPGVRDFAGPLGHATGAVYLFAAAASLWFSRAERLAARWPLIVLTVVHAGVLSVGAYSILVDSASQGAMPPVIGVFGLIHFESIVFSIGSAVLAVALVKERDEAVGRLAARIDPLTGVANRTAFMEGAGRIIARCRRESAPVSVMMFDLDRFKAVNDAYGHAVGDGVIRKFCEVAAAALRPNDALSRLGGDEFVVAMAGSSIEAAAVCGERICASFADSCRRVGDNRVNATVSGGVSASVNGEHGLSALLEYADIALYRAKADGGNCVKRADQPRPKAGSSNVYRVA